jgi:hypothetical protein
MIQAFYSWTITASNLKGYKLCFVSCSKYKYTSRLKILLQAKLQYKIVLNFSVNNEIQKPENQRSRSIFICQKYMSRSAQHRPEEALMFQTSKYVIYICLI